MPISAEPIEPRGTASPTPAAVRHEEMRLPVDPPAITEGIGPQLHDR
jgi:hypothetical protein